MWGFEVRSPHERGEVPPGQPETGDDPHTATNGKELGERTGMEGIDGDYAAAESERLNRIAPASPALEGEPRVIEPDPSGHVERLLQVVGGDGRRLAAFPP